MNLDGNHHTFEREEWGRWFSSSDGRKLIATPPRRGGEFGLSAFLIAVDLDTGRSLEYEDIARPLKQVPKPWEVT